jgi:hypothetical protein
MPSGADVAQRVASRCYRADEPSQLCFLLTQRVNAIRQNETENVNRRRKSDKEKTLEIEYHPLSRRQRGEAYTPKQLALFTWTPPPPPNTHTHNTQHTSHIAHNTHNTHTHTQTEHTHTHTQTATGICDLFPCTGPVVLHACTW